MIKIGQVTDTETIENAKEKLHNDFSTPVYVHFTTWKERDRFVPEMLSYFSQQTFKPTKIVCWLSISEYHHTVPPSVQDCLDRHLLDEVRWVKGNTYCHKRWEAFKYFADGYNIMIDDDIYYPPDHVELLLAYSLAYPRTVVCYYGHRSVYQHGHWTYEPFQPGPAHQNELYSGACCFAPGLLPPQVLRYRWKRTLYCRRCDDSWVKAWLIKSDIPVVGCKPWRLGIYNVIDNTQANGIWETINKVKHRGVIQKYTTFCDALYHIGAAQAGERVWPDIDISRYRTIVRTILSSWVPVGLRKRLHRIARRAFLMR